MLVTYKSNKGVLAKKSALSLLVAVVLCGMVAAEGVMVGDAEALTYQDTVDVQFTIEPKVNITMSSGDLVIPELAPGSALDSNIITVTAGTSNERGYTLYSTVGSADENYTDLRTSTTNTANVFSNLSTNKATLADFGDNTWGYSYSKNAGTSWVSGDSNSAASGYAGLPIYSNTGVKLIDTDAASEAEIQFKIAAKAAGTQARGTYTNIVNFIGVAKLAESSYTVIYHDSEDDSKGATNMPATQTGTTSNGMVTLSTMVPVLADASFAGWCSEAPAGDGTCGGTVVQPGRNYILGTDAAVVTVDMYAMWKTGAAPGGCGTLATMQSVDDSTISGPTQLCDERDGKIYWVDKLPDGKVWMTQNLDLELGAPNLAAGNTDGTLTPSDSNVSSNWTPSIATQTHQYKESDGTIHNTGIDNALWNTTDTTFGYNYAPHSYRPASDPTAGTSGDYGNDGDTYYAPAYMKNGTTMASYKTEAECTADGNTQSDCQHWSVGTFYSWYAATAGTGNASVSTVTNVPDSVCPKGWHLPSSTSSGEFQNLVTKGGITASNITGAPYYFLRAGGYVGDYGAVYGTGSYGVYWSSTSGSNTDGAYCLDFYSGYVGPSNDDFRYLGFSVRCVAGS